MKKSIGLLNHFLGAALFIVAVGCGDVETGIDGATLELEELERVEQDLFYKSSRLWNFEDTFDSALFSVGEIPVCFEDYVPEHAEEREWIETLMTGPRSWSTYGAIEFVGWGECDHTNYPWGIWVQPATYGGSTMGLREGDLFLRMQLPFLKDNPEDIFDQCIPNNLTRRECMEVIALHEFGHALGFTHEHERADAPASCTDGLTPDSFQFPGDYTFGSWDPVSVVSYCGDATDLSPIDIAGMQAVYGSDYLHDFGWDQGWKSLYHSRLTADVNGDGRQDIVGFGDHGVEVSLATAHGFTAPGLWTTDFGVETMLWHKNQYPVAMTDLNGDGRDDIVGFHASGVLGALSTGSDFISMGFLLYGHFGAYPSGGSWSMSEHLRYLSDVNGDGLDDVVGFGDDGVYVAINDGWEFSEPTRWSPYFGSAAGWNQRFYPRTMADVNGDGREDLIAFYNGIYVGISTGTGFSLQYWSADFAANQGWDGDKHLRIMTDVDGNGRMDVVGFGDEGVWVARSTGTSFTPRQLWLGDLGYGSAAGAWRIDPHHRMMADVNGDGRSDVVGFGQDFTWVALSMGTTFTDANPWALRYAANDGLTLGENPRTMADVDGDGAADIVGFLDHGTLVTTLSNISVQNQFIQED